MRTSTHIVRLYVRSISAIVVIATAVELVPLNRHDYVQYLKKPSRSRYEQLVKCEEGRIPRDLGKGDIGKLLTDLDHQTEATKSGQEIGDELLGGKKKAKSKEGGTEEKEHDSSVTDNDSQELSIPDAPVLFDERGVPEKTTAEESGASYLTGKPTLVVNKENKDPDVDKWFIYYPLHTERDEQVT